jgi:DNA gyrase subunit A
MNNNIINIPLEESVRINYLDYAMSVIISRALPDVRDGLKPVHRRILYAMYKMGLAHNRPYRKSARIVGEVIGKYHPHGDTSVYDALVRLAQEFSLRYPLVDGQGNFGSVDDDPPAAMRYTEARMTALAEEMLSDIDKDTVDFSPNYDGSELEPVVMPTRIPNLLINGCAGIAVGMSTEIPPHNLNEIIDALLYIIDNQSYVINDLLDIIKGPDFPTGGFITGRSGIIDTYKTGYGSITVRGKANIETSKTGKEQIIITELPYKVNKAALITHIAEMVNDKRLEGITDIRDESDRDGIRVAIDIKKGENSEIILNRLYKETKLEEKYHYQLLAIEDGKPKTFNLSEMLEAFIKHRKDIVRRRTKFLLNKALEHLHILEGLIVALKNIDEVINIIKASNSPNGASQNLIKRFNLSALQAEAILKMQLQRLTSLEIDKINADYDETNKNIEYYRSILGNNDVLMAIIKEELIDIKNKYADHRRTVILEGVADIDVMDLIPNDEKIIILSNSGFVKRMDITYIRTQKRGGKGTSGGNYKEGDYIEHALIAHNHDNLMFFTNNGKIYYLLVYKIPEMSREARGTYIYNILPLDKNERVQSILPINLESSDMYIFFVTKHGMVKKTSLEQFKSIRSGVIAIKLHNDDEIISTFLVKKDTPVFITTYQGKVINFLSDEIRKMGRVAVGVRGIKLRNKDYVVSAFPVYDEHSYILSITSKAYGKLTAINEYRSQLRGGMGIKLCNINAKTGHLVGAKLVNLEDEIIVITKMGKNIKISVKDISIVGRSSQGVKIMNIQDDEIVSIAVIRDI